MEESPFSCGLLTFWLGGQTMTVHTNKYMAGDGKFCEETQIGGQG